VGFAHVAYRQFWWPGSTVECNCEYHGTKMIGMVWINVVGSLLSVVEVVQYADQQFKGNWNFLRFQFLGFWFLIVLRVLDSL
jgi:hypothetical protein